MGGIARVRALTATGFIFACIFALFGFAGVTLGGPTRALQTVRYHGVSVRVPRPWPVFDLARHPQTCVRFNRHAVYFGTPGRQERCPAHAVGRTDAILISPLRATKGAPVAMAGGLGLEGDVSSYSLRTAGVEVTSTWSRSPRVVSRALGRNSLPRANGRAANSSKSTVPGPPATGSAQRGRHYVRGSTFTGLGFDACTAPSRSQMAAWSHSPYRGIGIYIGGIDMACAQPNLTRTWIKHEIASGWHPAPLYVGLQAEGSGCGCHTLSLNTAQAHSEGLAAARDAVAHAQRLGILPGNPIYYDMEGHSTGGSNTAAVLAFFSGWTSVLHADRYISGVYGSASTTMSGLVPKYHTRYREPDDIWIADWNGQRTTRDPYVPASEWSHHQRLHQYAGGHNESYGGVTINIDNDFLSGATANARDGYMLLTSNGGIHLFGPIVGHGSEAGKLPRGVSAVALARDRKTGGYWILRSDGGVRAFHAPFHGSLRQKLRGARPVAMAGSPRGGYQILTSDGRVHSFDASWFGSDTSKIAPGVSAVALATDRKTSGYWILRSDGAVDSFHAPHYGGLKNRLRGAVPVALAAAQHGGYFILTSNGAVHHFGPAKFHGSDAGKLPAGVTAVSIATSPTTTGYRILRSDGGVDSFSAIRYGSLLSKLHGRSRPVAIADASG
jgi:Domain of unknown function (DUF1906)